jgi:ribosomal protein S18 acetylase RimI-like enzyme
LVLICFRSFRNSDPPGIADVWRRQPPQRGLVQPMLPTLFERHVLSKLYFDREGLIVAESEGRIVGFAHAGFGPTDDFSDISTELGTTAMLMTVASDDGLADELLARSEERLRSRGAKVLYAGGIWPLNPFYLGLYGGSEAPGILTSSRSLVEIFTRAGYEEIDRVLVFQRELAGFRSPVDRQQIQWRRNCQIEAELDPPPANWWEACQWAQSDRYRFSLRLRGGPVCGTAVYWDMEPLASSWGVHAAGLIQFEVDAGQRRQGLGTFLVAESMRQMHEQGATLVETQTMQSNTAAVGLYKKLGFKEVDQGLVLRKRK